ncbi:MAG: hypothetical protein HYY06_29695 [Deltaproteobacteria bacterium]|nr:hypothetical protein [Deltaproteobacteria bacterium]
MRVRARAEQEGAKVDSLRRSDQAPSSRESGGCGGAQPHRGDGEKYQVFLLPALLLILADAVLGEAVRRKRSKALGRLRG